MSADSIVSSAISNIPKAVAAGVVDMGTGMLLGVKTTESHPQEVLDLVAAGTKELFEGDSSMSIENTFKKDRGDSDKDHYFQEIIINSKNLIHVFSRLKSNQGVVMVVVCRIDANLGQVVMKSREICGTESV
ncbi:MAG: hypothetical protein P8126_08435 [Gammaproteobacteria bacterium]|jgi:hypothetical protein